MIALYGNTKRMEENNNMNILKSIRYKEWLTSKIPLMAVPMLGYMMSQGTTIYNILLLIQWVLFLMCFYAFGYIINDYADREADKIVGKENSLIHVSKFNASMRVFIVFISGFLIALYNHYDIKSFLILIAIYVLGASYSAKPFRFKEKGILGVIVSSFAQRSMPLLLLVSYINIDVVELVLWMALGFAVGIRYIFIHQYIDLDNDLKSGITTFLTKRKFNVELTIKIVFVCEIVLVAVLGWIHSNMIVLILFSALYTLQLSFSYVTVHEIYKQNYWCSYICVPMEDYYNIYLPIIFMVNLILTETYWIVPLAIFVVLMAPTIKKKLEIPVFYFKCGGDKK